MSHCSLLLSLFEGGSVATMIIWEIFCFARICLHPLVAVTTVCLHRISQGWAVHQRAWASLTSFPWMFFIRFFFLFSLPSLCCCSSPVVVVAAHAQHIFYLFETHVFTCALYVQDLVLWFESILTLFYNDHLMLYSCYPPTANVIKWECIDHYRETWVEFENVGPWAQTDKRPPTHCFWL